VKPKPSLRALLQSMALITTLLAAAPAFSLEEKVKIEPSFAIFFLYPTGKVTTTPVMAGFYKITVPVKLEGVPEAQILIKRDTFETTVIPEGAVTATASRVTYDDMVVNITGAREGKIKVHIWAYASTFDDRKAIYDREVTVKCDPDGSEAIVVPADLKTPPKVYPDYMSANKTITYKQPGFKEQKIIYPAQDTNTIHNNVMDCMRENPELASKGILPGALRVIMKYPSGPTADLDNAPGSYTVSFNAAKIDTPEVVLTIDRNSRSADASVPGAVCFYVYEGERDELIADVFGVLSGPDRAVSINVFRGPAAAGEPNYSKKVSLSIPTDRIPEIKVPFDFKSDITTGTADFSSLEYAGADILVSLGMEKLNPEDLAEPDWLLKPRNPHGTVLGTSWNETSGNLPEARIKGPRAVNAGDTVLLDASDSKGAFPEFLWQQTAGAPVSISNPSSQKISFKPTETGLYSFLLSVKSGEQTDYSFIDINVIGKINAKAELVNSVPLDSKANKFFLLGKTLIVPISPITEIHTYDISDPANPTFKKRYILTLNAEERIPVDSKMFGNILLLSPVFYSGNSGPAKTPTDNRQSAISAYRVGADEEFELLGSKKIGENDAFLSGIHETAFLITQKSLFRLDTSSRFSTDNFETFALPALDPGNSHREFIWMLPFDSSHFIVNDTGPGYKSYFEIKDNELRRATAPDTIRFHEYLGIWDAPGEERYLLTSDQNEKRNIEIIEIRNITDARKRASLPVPGDNCKHFSDALGRIYGSLAIVWWPLGEPGENKGLRFALFDLSNPDKPVVNTTFDVKGNSVGNAVYNNKFIYAIVNTTEGDFLQVYRITSN